MFFIIYAERLGQETMNILILTQFFNPTRGGGEFMFHQLAEQLGKNGHKVFVIKHKMLGSGSSKDHPEDLPLNVIVYEVDPPVVHRGGLPAGVLQNLLYVFNSVKVGLRIIKNDEIDVIHCNNYSPVFAGWFLSKLTRRPFVVTIHDVASLHGYGFWKKWMEQFGRLSWIRALIGYVSELLTLKLSKNIHTVSDTSKKDILSFNPKSNVFVISNSLDLEYYDNEDITYEDFILFIGRLVYYKHLEVVIEALKLLKDRCNVRLIVLGDGPMRNRWEHLVDRWKLKDRVEFKGYVPHKEKLYYLSKCKSLVLPSTFEGFGIVILEAWALRKPVIVADVEPLNRIVEHGSDGFIIEKNLPATWAEYIHLLISGKELSKQLGNKGYRKLVERYNIDKYVNEMEKLYIKTVATEK